MPSCPVPHLRDPLEQPLWVPSLLHWCKHMGWGGHGPLNVCFQTEDQTGDARQQQHGAVRAEAPLPRAAAPGLWTCSPPGGFEISHFMYGSRASAPGSPGVSVPLACLRPIAGRPSTVPSGQLPFPTCMRWGVADHPQPSPRKRLDPGGWATAGPEPEASPGGGHTSISRSLHSSPYDPGCQLV